MKNIQTKLKLICVLLIFSNNTYSQQRVLDVNYVYQIHACCWCWAACITMIGNYYGNEQLQLCEVVDMRRINSSMGSNDCCNMQTPYVMNDTITCISSSTFGSNTDPISTIFQNNLGINSSIVFNALSYGAIKTEIDSNRPIKVVAGRPSSSGFGSSYHSLVIIGYDDNGQIIHYIDPISGYYADNYSNITSSLCMGQFNYQYGYRSSCNYVFSNDPCPKDLNLTFNIGSNAVVRASNTIHCNSTIQNYTSVHFISGSHVQLNSGFGVEIGSVLFVNTTNDPCP